ncbi:class I SAM-dependent methyltransferase [Aquibacillus koreensis]|uniref:Class I SAM-dependent methyltransferase n=1 Tax=Aquibacillus koreensis TaxID=279446 RepID=A0A9X3WNM7_9BACI|nr:class I SAM-dependent methyltransferase [Aquibacillus koreensis]MCT2534916.1 class I SAM-dependent methyltransferase [Aquibacillus koreensis]MDC3422190.1 class I SAM-dependent methyltransferase [Aquibacillus koreensis]
MVINFDGKSMKHSYASRVASFSWKQAIKDILTNKDVHHAVDLGCGGGIYSKALLDCGVQEVIGIDSSYSILEGARENCHGESRIKLAYGTAEETGLERSTYHLVLARALIHHLPTINPFIKEAHRILKRGGVFVIQDRDFADCLTEPSNTNIRGYFFEQFPRLIKLEKERRYAGEKVIDALEKQGFIDIEEIKLWEVRKAHQSKESLLSEIKQRTGRSILHALSDHEIEELIDYLDVRLPNNEPVLEQDCWTMWKAVKK